MGTDVTVQVTDGVADVVLHRPPENYFDLDLVRDLAEAYRGLDEDPGCRVIVLSSEGKHFCAGANFAGAGTGDPAALYREAVRLFDARTPVVAAVQGAAVGGGLGLACSADFRVATPAARFSANFARLGFHQGFGLSVTLPAIVGRQHSLDLLYTGRRIDGAEALRIGLCDRLANADDLLAAAHEFAGQIAGSAPLAVASIRATLRADLVARVHEVVKREADEQNRLRGTSDWAEGVRASAERRPPRFTGT